MSMQTIRPHDANRDWLTLGLVITVLIIAFITGLANLIR